MCVETVKEAEMAQKSGDIFRPKNGERERERAKLVFYFLF
jgi:hypothetical protein